MRKWIYFPNGLGLNKNENILNIEYAKNDEKHIKNTTPFRILSLVIIKKELSKCLSHDPCSRLICTFNKWQISYPLFHVGYKFRKQFRPCLIANIVH